MMIEKYLTGSTRSENHEQNFDHILVSRIHFMCKLVAQKTSISIEFSPRRRVSNSLVSCNFDEAENFFSLSLSCSQSSMHGRHKSWVVAGLLACFYGIVVVAWSRHVSVCMSRYPRYMRPRNVHRHPSLF